MHALSTISKKTRNRKRNKAKMKKRMEEQRMEEPNGRGPFLHMLVREGPRLWGGYSDVGQSVKMVFLEHLMEEQMMKLVGVELGRSRDREGWLIQVCDQAGAVITVGIGAGDRPAPRPRFCSRIVVS